MTAPTTILRLRSSFIYDDSHTELNLSLPITPWMPSASSLGGDIESDAGVRASFIICQRETLGLTLRFFEDQWADVQRWIEVVQSGLPFTWVPDPTYLNYREYTDIILEGPAIGTKYAAMPDPVFPRVLQLPIVIGRLGCNVFNMAEIPAPMQFAIIDDRYTITRIFDHSAMLNVLIVGGGAGGGGLGGNGNGGGGGGVIYDTVEAHLGTLTVAIGLGGAAGGNGGDSSLSYPSDDVGGTAELIAHGGGGPGSDIGGLSGAPTAHVGGSSLATGFGGTPPDFGDAYGAAGGGGGGGASQVGEDATLDVGSHTAFGGRGGNGLTTPFGVFGGGGGGGCSSSGLGSAHPGDGGDGGGGNGLEGGGVPGVGGTGGGGGGNADGGGGLVIIGWVLGTIVGGEG